jgi:hypothetical protein
LSSASITDNKPKRLGFHKFTNSDDKNELEQLQNNFQRRETAFIFHNPQQNHRQPVPHASQPNHPNQRNPKQ